MYFHACFVAEHSPDLRLRELFATVALHGEGFKCFAGGVLAGGDESGGKGFRDVEGDFHGDSVAPG